MSYEEFVTEIKKYWELRSQGLKKQANRFLFQFTEHFKKDISRDEADDILFHFCRDYIDEIKFPGENLPRRHVPFQLSELLYHYFNRECEENKMPQMRWAFQIFGKYYNPGGPEGEKNPYYILEKAYAHDQCDQQTVDAYFGEQVDVLWWGQHHFPEGCLITRKEFEDTVEMAKKILSENSVEQGLAEDFAYYEKLYHIYFDWEKQGKKGDFYQLCKEEGIAFESMPAFYYSQKHPKKTCGNC